MTRCFDPRDRRRPTPTQHGARLSRLVTFDRIHHALYVECRERDKHEATPTAAIIDSQSVKSAEKGDPVSIRMALMRARRSKARSATFL